MVFNSLSFAIFIAFVLAVHYSPTPWRLRKLNLVVCSYAFYAAWNPPFVFLLVLSTAVDWLLSRAMWRRPPGRERKALLMMSLVVNLGILGVFKYGSFIIANLNTLAGTFGFSFSEELIGVDLFLPVGISFYTFQTLSYTIDVYRGRLRPCDSILDFGLYVSFFPQLVAGPIVRATHFIPQLVAEKRATARQFAWGCMLIILGLFQKIVIADGWCAPVADPVYATDTALTSVAAWMGTFAFSLQIFCDFAGYTTCAIGTAMLMGFELPDNFRQPYAAIGFSDFWRRWHMSLSTWLRDYLYIPLGGNRLGATRTHVNLMATMLLGGLWHGASWTFVIWGALHGLFLTGERVWRGDEPNPDPQSPMGAFLGVVVTYILVCITWVFFRAQTFDGAFNVLLPMLGFVDDSAHSPVPLRKFLPIPALVVATLLVHWRLRNTTIEHYVSQTKWWVVSLAIAAMVFLIASAPGDSRAFIYFQF